MASPLPGPSSFNPDTSLLESDADRSFSQSTIQQQKQLHQTTNANDALIQQREREIEDIAQGIIGLSDLFRDLNTMIIDQGTLLDRIDYNIERTATDVRAAEKDIVVAERYQKKSTKRKIIFLLILIIFGVIVLLVIRPERKPAVKDDAQGPLAVEEPAVDSPG